MQTISANIGYDITSYIEKLRFVWLITNSKFAFNCNNLQQKQTSPMRKHLHQRVILNNSRLIGCFASLTLEQIYDRFIFGVIGLCIIKCFKKLLLFLVGEYV